MQEKANRIERITSGVLTVAAVVIAMTFVHREFFSAPPTPSSVNSPPAFDPHWKDMLVDGRRSGVENAPVTIVEFSDYECPFCRKFQMIVDTVAKKFGDKIALVYIHFPLPIHRFAEPAARAAECANDQGRFSEMSAKLFQKQDSLGLKPWTSYAVESGVSDSAKFAACLASQHAADRPARGKALALKLGLKGTPTVFVNGWRFAQPPSDDLLTDTIEKLLAGEKPKGAD